MPGPKTKNLSLRQSFGAAVSGISATPNLMQILPTHQSKTNFAVNFSAPDRLDASKPIHFQSLNNMHVQQETIAQKRAQYLDLNEQASKTIRTAMNDADPVHGLQVWDMIAPRASADTTDAVIELALSASPLGPAQDVYTLLSAAHKEKKHDEKLIAQVLEKTLSRLHALSHPDHQADRTRFNFTAIESPQALRNFIMRDVNQDPVMQNLAQKSADADKAQQNIDYVRTHYLDAPTPEKIAHAVEGGHMVLAQALCSSAITFHTDALREIKGLKMPVLDTGILDVAIVDTFKTPAHNGLEKGLVAMAFAYRPRARGLALAA